MAEYRSLKSYMAGLRRIASKDLACELGRARIDALDAFATGLVENCSHVYYMGEVCWPKRRKWIESHCELCVRYWARTW
jgi:hypothetical protein